MQVSVHGAGKPETTRENDPVVCVVVGLCVRVCVCLCVCMCDECLLE